jgi:CBS domain-containing protein
MTISRILAVKGKTVTTISPEDTLQVVAETLARQGIGAVVVVDGDQRILGILSERDIVKAVGRDSAGALAKPAATVMTQRVETCQESELILSVMERMTRGRFRHMPVVRDGRLDGIVSIGDIVKHRLAEIESEKDALTSYIQMAS